MRWILIDATPGQVWPLIRDYWTELQIALDYENPSAGILETSWVEIGLDQENRHKYQIRIEPGLHSGYSKYTSPIYRIFVRSDSDSRNLAGRVFFIGSGTGHACVRCLSSWLIGTIFTRRLPQLAGWHHSGRKQGEHHYW